MIKSIKKVLDSGIFAVFYGFNFAIFVVSEQKIPSFVHGKKYSFTKDLPYDIFFDKFLSNSPANNYVFDCQGDINNLLRYCLNRFSLRKAAGGVVADGADNYLLIHRNGMWDLPKGHVEPGETHSFAALREVTEETGVKKLSISNLITKTYHIYQLDGKWILKQTSWYNMQTSCNQTLTPQTEEGIDKVVWMPECDMHQKLSSSFATLDYLSSTIKQKGTAA